jgi:hypothetical protein
MNQPAGTQGRNVDDAVIGVIRRGHIVHGKQDAGHYLDDSYEKRGAAERVEPVDMWDLAKEYGIPDLAPAKPFIHPVSKSGEHVSLSARTGCRLLS